MKVAVTLPGNYQRASKPGSPLLTIHGWTDGECDALRQHLLLQARYVDSSMVWLEDCVVRDAERGKPLPDTLHVLVLASKSWDGQIGGTSWFATTAFISQEAAEKLASEWESELSWYWVVTAKRFVPEKSAQT